MRKDSDIQFENMTDNEVMEYLITMRDEYANKGTGINNALKARVDSMLGEAYDNASRILMQIQQGDPNREDTHTATTNGGINAGWVRNQRRNLRNWGDETGDE